MYLAYTGIGVSVLVYGLIGVGMIASGAALRILGRKHPTE